MPRYGMEKTKAPEYVPGGGSDSVDLRQRNILAAMLLVLNYRWTVTGGDGTGALRADPHAWFINKISTTANGELQSYDGPFLDAYNAMFLQEVLSQTVPTAIAAATDQAGKRALWLLPFQMGHSYTPEEFGLPTRAVSTPTLTIDWANPRRAVIAPHAAAAFALNDAKTELWERPYVDPVPPAGGFAPLLIRQQTVDVVQSGEVVVQLANIVRGHEIRAIFLQAYKGGTAGGNDFVAADDVVTGARLIVNAKPVIGETKVPWYALQQLNKIHYQAATLRTGLAILDAAEDRRTGRGELWTVTSTEKPYLELDTVDQAGDVKIVVTTVYTARTAPRRTR